MGVGKKLSNIIKDKGLKVTKVAAASGIPVQTLYSIIRRDNAKVALEQLTALSKVLGVDISYFTEHEAPKIEAREADEPTMIPLVGAVHAGWNAYAEQRYDEYLPAYGVSNPDRYVWLRVNGDSMEPRMFDGDSVLVKLQNTALNGDYVVAIVNEEATIKKFQKSPEGIYLIPINQKYSPIFIPPEEMDTFYIYGVAVEIKAVL